MFFKNDNRSCISRVEVTPPSGGPNRRYILWPPPLKVFVLTKISDEKYTCRKGSNNPKLWLICSLPLFKDIVLVCTGLPESEKIKGKKHIYVNMLLSIFPSTWNNSKILLLQRQTKIEDYYEETFVWAQWLPGASRDLRLPAASRCLRHHVTCESKPRPPLFLSNPYLCIPHNISGSSGSTHSPTHHISASCVWRRRVVIINGKWH